MYAVRLGGIMTRERPDVEMGTWARLESVNMTNFKSTGWWTLASSEFKAKDTGDQEV